MNLARKVGIAFIILLWCGPLLLLLDMYEPAPAVKRSVPCTGEYPSADGNFVLKPDCSGMFNGSFATLHPTMISTNSEGFRGADYSLVKNSETFRVIILGDSFTFGWGLNIEDSYPFLLEKKLNARATKSQGGTFDTFEVMNLAIPGFNSANEVWAFREYGLKYNPDVVVLAFFTNDDETYALNNELVKLLQERPAGYVDKMQNLRNNPKNKNLSIMSVPIEELVALSEKNNFSLLIYSMDSEQYQQEYLAGLEKTRNNVIFENASVFFGSNPRYYLDTNDKHPSPIMADIYAEDLYRIISQNYLG